MKDCMKCKFKITYIAENDPNDVLNICTAESAEHTGDGGCNYFEVTEFNSEDCLLFRL